MLDSFRCPFADHYSKKLTVGAAITLFVEAQFQQRRTLPDIVLHLQTNPELQEIVGLTTIHESTLNRKLDAIPLAYLEWLFAALVQELKGRKAGAKGIRHFGKLTPVDSTSLSLPKVLGDWAFYQDKTKGVKIHTRLLSLEVGCHVPDELVLSTIGVSDQQVVKRLVTPADTTYIFDRGYVHYGNFREWSEGTVLFVARLRAKTRYTVQAERPISNKSNILRDADVEMLDKNSCQTFQVRLVQFQDQHRKIYEVITNRRDLSAEDIGEIYRCRWQIELFFKWIKQHLATVNFHNHHPHAVWVQCYIGIIAALLCQLIHLELQSAQSVWNVLRKIRYYAMEDWDVFVSVLNREPTHLRKEDRRFLSRQSPHFKRKKNERR
ncbi:IS4 family transposase [Paenibacillus graminis]|uniref:IS4 family transposase n=1 Tax=Paenibacillus graminis TaxID=189425 RepID=UPI002DBEF13E|nr:IS4 family transposase [Paenibacillus graminis]MEC0172727.1 IS4 family transposase [Paenibacillus graminis]